MPSLCCFAAVTLALSLLPVFAQKTSPQSSSRTWSSQPSSHAAALDPGSIREGVYRNPMFGFSYKIPYGWVDRTEQMAGDSRDADAPAPARPADSQPRLLLAVFERPPEAASDGIDPAVVITAESAASYPGLKSAEDYLGPLTEVITSKGFKVVNEAYEFPVGAKRLARVDFSKEGKVPAFQSSLVTLEKGYVISLSFLGAASDDVDELIRGFSFGPAPKPEAAKPASPRPDR
jgi:hypothetical protein